MLHVVNQSNCKLVYYLNFLFIDFRVKIIEMKWSASAHNNNVQSLKLGQCAGQRRQVYRITPIFAGNFRVCVPAALFEFSRPYFVPPCLAYAASENAISGDDDAIGLYHKRPQ